MVLVSFALFTGLIAAITYMMTRDDDHASSDGYFLAGRRLTGPFIAGSLLLTNLSTEQMVGLNGAAFSDSFSVVAWEVIAVCALVLMGLFFLPRFLKSGVATVPQFLEERFDQGTRTITTLIFLIAYAVIVLPIILHTGARGLNGIQSELGMITFTVLLVGLIGTTYAIFGGLRTVAVSDTLNGIGLLIGGFLIVYFALQMVSGGEGVFAGLGAISETHPDPLHRRIAAQYLLLEHQPADHPTDLWRQEFARRPERRPDLRCAQDIGPALFGTAGHYRLSSLRRHRYQSRYRLWPIGPRCVAGAAYWAFPSRSPNLGNSSTPAMWR